VRNVRNEISPHAIHLGELGRHRVESASKVADLVEGRRGNGATELSTRHVARRVGHLSERRRHAASEEMNHRQRHESRNDPLR
jgi:hypothetical protein